jgi:putative sterol carrier protein
MALKSDKLFDLMIQYIKDNGKEIVPKVKYVYQFDVKAKKDDTPVSWTIDLKNGDGFVKKGTPEKPDATFTMLDDDVMAMANKTLNPQQAFMNGKMKIKGNMAAATKFTPDLLPPMPKL